MVSVFFCFNGYMVSVYGVFICFVQMFQLDIQNAFEIVHPCVY